MLQEITISPELFNQFPDYTVELLAVKGIKGGPSDARSEALLVEAERETLNLLSTTELENLSEVQRWRAAFEAFGVKPRVARSSFEALLRRVEKGLPRIDLLTDIYNSISVLYRIPIGGENLDAYRGPARLVLAAGDENFDIRENGELVNQSPEPGEPVWRDDAGVTCRRWNWRQCVRTRLDEDTESILFILDGLGPDSKNTAAVAAHRLSVEITKFWPDAEIQRRQISA